MQFEISGNISALASYLGQPGRISADELNAFENTQTNTKVLLVLFRVNSWIVSSGRGKELEPQIRRLLFRPFHVALLPTSTNECVLTKAGTRRPETWLLAQHAAYDREPRHNARLGKLKSIG